MSSPTLLTLTLVACAGLTLVPLASGQRSRYRDGIPREWSVFEYPDPHSLNQDQQRLCGRYNVSSVCDPNGLISETDANALDSLINSVYRETTCLCADCILKGHGYIIRVAIMPKMQRVFPRGENTTIGRLRDAQMYSYILTNRWRMEGACNETLLILYSEGDGILYTLTRQNTKLKLSNGDVKRISMTVRHYFDDQSTIADGLMEMIRRYRLVFEDNYLEAFQPSAGGGRQG